MGLKWIALLCLALAACETVPAKPTKKSGVARITFYNKHEDKYGNRIACSSHKRATRGKTIAAERTFPFGTIIRIPWLAKFIGNGSYIVEDRGSAVESRRASRGRTPVLDVYAESKREMIRLAKLVPPYLPFEVE
jgi:3D (Asp-Asp-Asp) domain-containing protein